MLFTTGRELILSGTPITGPLMASHGDRTQRTDSLPRELLEARDRGELIVCVGPQLAEDAGLPSSAELAHALIRDVEGSRSVDAKTLREWIARGRVEEALELLERRMGARFIRVVERELGARQQLVPPLARAIAALEGKLRAVYTTGIDRVLERAFDDAWPSFSTAQADLVRRRKLIVKLCGTLEFPETWALTRAARERELGGQALRRRLVAAASRAHCLLFVGFDLDDELSERLFAIVAPAESAGQAPAHFVVAEGCTLEQRRLLESRGLVVLDGEATPLLTRLGDRRPRRDSGADPGLPSCPYPGLEAFDASLERVFHGRRAELSSAAARLGGPPDRHRRWLAIDGSSGVGKSSFVHAGLLPALRRGFAEGTPPRWWVASLRPGQRPLRALVEAVTATVANEVEVDPSRAFTPGPDGIHDAPSSLTSFVGAHKPEGVALLLVVDQLEEIVTLATPRERGHFAACLSALLGQRLIYLVTTLRSDFTAAVSAAMPALARLLNEEAERFTLAPISRVGLRAAIAEPAAQLGVAFEAELVERIASDAAQHLGDRRDEDGVVRTDDAALPLVAHVLRGLWDAGAAEDGAVSFAEYEALGGVSGALSRSADGLLASLDARQKSRARVLLLRMVNLDDGRLTRRSLGRDEARALAGGEDEGERLLRLLSGAAGPRLIVVRGEGEEARVDLVHEALLREWDTLRGWIAADRAQLARDEALARRAASWDSQGRSWRSLPRGPERRELLRGRTHGSGARQQREYQRAMRTVAWARGGAWLGFCAVLAGLGSLGLERLDEAQAKTEIAEKEARESKEESRELERRSKVAEGSLDFKEELSKIEDSLQQRKCRDAIEGLLDLGAYNSPEADELLERASRCEAVIGKRAVNHPGKTRVTALVEDPDDGVLWIGDLAGTLTHVRSDGTASISPKLHNEAIEDIVFSPAGDHVALGGRGTTVVVDRNSAELVEPCEGHDPHFSPDGRRLVTRNDKNVDRLYLYESLGDDRPALPVDLPGVWDHEFSPEGEFIYVVRSTRGGSTIERLFAGDLTSDEDWQISVPGLVREIAISPDGALVAATGDDKLTHLWSVASRVPVAPPLAHDIVVLSDAFVEFAPSGEMLMSLRRNDELVVTDLDLRPLGEHAPIDRSVRPRFSPDARWVLAADPQGSAVSLRGARSGQVVARLEPPGMPSALAVLAKAGGLAIGDADGQTTVWALDTRDHWRFDHAGGVRGLAFSPGQFGALYSGSSDDSLRRWQLGGDAQRYAGTIRAMAIHVEAGGARGYALDRSGALYEWQESLDSLREIEDLGCAVKQANFSSSGDRLAIACEGGGLELWTLASELKLLPPPPLRSDASLVGLALGSGGRNLALGYRDGQIQQWQLGEEGVEPPEEPVASGLHPGLRALAYDATATRLVSGGTSDVVKVWSRGQKDALSFKVLVNSSAVAISRDGAMIAIGEREGGRVQLRGLEQRTEGLEACPSSRIEALAFSPNDDLLAAGCGNGEVHVWPLSPAAHRELACQRLAATGEPPEACPTQAED